LNGPFPNRPSFLGLSGQYEEVDGGFGPWEEPPAKKIIGMEGETLLLPF